MTLFHLFNGFNSDSNFFLIVFHPVHPKILQILILTVGYYKSGHLSNISLLFPFL